MGSHIIEFLSNVRKWERYVHRSLRYSENYPDGPERELKPDIKKERSDFSYRSMIMIMIIVKKKSNLGGFFFSEFRRIVIRKQLQNT